jgi:hypothetical protein
VGQVFKFVWSLCWKINVVCMSLSPFVSFQSRFVTYLLNFPRMYMRLTLLRQGSWYVDITIVWFHWATVTLIPLYVV